jgi:hypothetical protein
MKAISVLMFLVAVNLFASDHIDGPVTKEHGVTDIADLFVFPSEDKDQNLNLILNVYPMVSPKGHFSEKVNYVFQLRKLQLDNQNSIQTYEEVKIECSFQTPHGHNYSVLCAGSNGLRSKGKVNQIIDADFKLFAGMRSDPFFLNQEWVTHSVEQGFLGVSDGTNVMDQLNVLSIVIELNLNDLFEDYNNELIAVAAKSMGRDHAHARWKQIDWVGRPEVTNFTMIPDSEVLELRDFYNLEVPFQRPMKKEDLYKERMIENILVHYDHQDMTKDWDRSKAEKFVDLLLNDFLIVAPSNPCSKDSYFSIEYALLNGLEINDCGGRQLQDDVVDKILSLYIASDLDKLSDGVDKAYRSISREFPYLNKPDTSLSARMKAWLARQFQ